MTETAQPSQLVEYAYDRVRDAILTNTLPAFESFSQSQLAREFGISRTPIREAVRLLEYEGLAMSEFNKRVRVAGMTPEDLETLYALRILSECLVLHSRVPNMSAQFLATSRERLEAMEAASKTQDIETWSEIHREFHLTLVNGTNSRFDQLIVQSYDHAERYRRFYLADSTHNWGLSQCQHQSIQEACEEKDAARAARLLAMHYATTARGVLRVLDPTYKPDFITSSVKMVKALIFLDELPPEEASCQY